MRVLVVTGSSGGHIFPALSFVDALQNRGQDALLVLPKSNFLDQSYLEGYKVRYICVSSIKLCPNFKNLIALFNFFKGFLEGASIISQFRPDVVVGFGSIASLPILLSGRMFKAKTMIHEQNVIPGRANRFLAGSADKIAVSFDETRSYFKCRAEKIILSCNPLRKELVKIDKVKALNFFGLGDDKFTILVMGGSQGSHSLNLGFLKAISMLPDRSRLQVIHLSGAKEELYLKDNYKQIGVNARIFSFLKDMHYAYSACDLFISRAGAATISEAIFFELPALVVPYPFAYEHQLKNSAILERQGCALIIKDAELQTDRLKLVLEDLLNNPEKIKLMRYNYNNIPKANAAELLVKETLRLAS